MEWVVRIIGVVAIFGLAAWSVNEADRALVAATRSSQQETVARAVIDESPVLEGVEAAPPEYLAYFDDNTPGKIEVGAIGGEDNATFTEVPVCINENGGCEDED